MDYWAEAMQDDAYMISAEGWKAETLHQRQVRVHSVLAHPDTNGGELQMGLPDPILVRDENVGERLEAESTLIAYPESLQRRRTIRRAGLANSRPAPPAAGLAPPRCDEARRPRRARLRCPRGGAAIWPGLAPQSSLRVQPLKAALLRVS
jgi:hypothetical protein